MIDNKKAKIKRTSDQDADWFSVGIGMVAYFLLGWILVLFFFDPEPANVEMDRSFNGLSKLGGFFDRLQTVSFWMIGIGIITVILFSLKGYKNLRNGIWLGVGMTIVLLLVLNK